MSESLKEKGMRFQKQRDYVLDTNKPILVHVDGRSFSKNIKNKFKKPFDRDLIDMMNKTAVYLCEKVQGAQIAYVQSDEISLLIMKDGPDSDIFFGGRICKMQSIIASLATAKFQTLMTAYWLEKMNEENAVYGIKFITNQINDMPLYQFDCKVWDVDTPNDAFAWFLFRNIDCIRNSKQQFAQTYVPHKVLLKHSADEQVLMAMDDNGRDWRSCADDEKYGRIISHDILTFLNEDGLEYDRAKWIPHDGVDLTVPENREEFIEKYNFFKA